MSIKSKIAAIAAASLGMVLTQSSATRAETEDNSAPEKVTKITPPIDVNEDVFYSAVPDEVIENAASDRFGANFSPAPCPVKKPSSGGLKYETSPKGRTG